MILWDAGVDYLGRLRCETVFVATLRADCMSDLSRALYTRARCGFIFGATFELSLISMLGASVL